MRTIPSSDAITPLRIIQCDPNPPHISRAQWFAGVAGMILFTVGAAGVTWAFLPAVAALIATCWRVGGDEHRGE